MKIIVRKGVCNNCGGCCKNKGEGSWRFKNNVDICQYLRDDSGGIFTCILREKLEAGRTKAELEADYYKGVKEALVKHDCHFTDEFPAPRHFGLLGESEDENYGNGGRDGLIDWTIENFKKWKEKTGCVFVFEVVDT